MNDMSTIEREFFRYIDKLPFDVPFDYYDNCTASEIQLSGHEASLIELQDSLSGYRLQEIA